MSTTDDAPSILLSDDRDTVYDKIRTHAYSGGRASIEAHREQGGNPEIDVSYQFLYYFFEENDERVEQLAHTYRDGSLSSGEPKEIAAEEITNFLKRHQNRREALESLEEEPNIA